MFKIIWLNFNPNNHNFILKTQCFVCGVSSVSSRYGRQTNYFDKYFHLSSRKVSYMMFHQNTFEPSRKTLLGSKHQATNFVFNFYARSFWLVDSLQQFTQRVFSHNSFHLVFQFITHLSINCFLFILKLGL